MRNPNTIKTRQCGFIFLVGISLVSLAQGSGAAGSFYDENYRKPQAEGANVQSASAPLPSSSFTSPGDHLYENAKYDTPPSPLALELRRQAPKDTMWDRGGNLFNKDGLLVAKVLHGNFPVTRFELERTDAGRELIRSEERRRRDRDGRGFLDALFEDVSAADLPVVGMFSNMNGSFKEATLTSRAIERIARGEAVSVDDMVRISGFESKNAYNASGGIGATIGDIIRHAPRFVVEFAILVEILKILLNILKRISKKANMKMEICKLPEHPPMPVKLKIALISIAVLSSFGFMGKAKDCFVASLLVYLILLGLVYGMWRGRRICRMIITGLTVAAWLFAAAKDTTAAMIIFGLWAVPSVFLWLPDSSKWFECMNKICRGESCSR